MKIYLLLAHPDRGSFCGALADAFEAAAVTAGHEVRRQNLGEMDFEMDEPDGGAACVAAKVAARVAEAAEAMQMPMEAEAMAMEAEAAED